MQSQSYSITKTLIYDKIGSKASEMLWLENPNGDVTSPWKTARAHARSTSPGYLLSSVDIKLH